MSDPLPGEPDTLPPTSDAIDATCDRFEEAWREAVDGKTRPCIEDYLPEVPQAERTRLLLELILLDQFYRGKAGERVGAEDYLVRFPLLSRRRLERNIRRQEQAARAAPPSVVPLPVPTILAPGSVTIPGYEVLGLLGKGGMGIVYKARQLSLGRVVALKMVRYAEHAAEEERRRFRAEAEAIARLKHANVVQVHEVGESGGVPFFAMEFCECGSLDAQLDGTPWQPTRAAALVQTLAVAMHAAHAAGVVHRDLKPANVLLAADSTPKVADFGLAKRLDVPGPTRTGAIMGTPSYMAPEQAGGRKDIGPAADVWALGAILYELLTGRPPFNAATDLDTILQVLSEEPVAVRRLQPKVPHDLGTICHKCLHKDARKRYASAEALADDLQRFLAGEPIRARRVGSWERAAKWVRRRPAAATLMAMLLAVGLAVPVVGLQYAAQQIRQVEQKRLDEARAEVRNLLARGQTVAESKDWGKAEELLKEALVRVDAEARLEDLRDDVKAALDPVQRRVAARAAHRDFLRDRDDALFHATLAGGQDAPTNLRIAREKAEAALAAVGFSADGRGALRHTFTPEEKAEIIAGTYALLLMLAELEAQPGGPGLAQALALLKRAEALGISMRVLHLRRARYLEAQGKGEAAQAERRQAKALEGRADLYPQDASLVGLELYSQGELVKATEEFRRALRRMPDDFWNHYFLGLCCVSSNKAEEAVTHFTICQKQQPKLVWVYLLRGFALGKINSYTAAEEDFARALKFDLTDAARYVLLNNRGAMRLGRPEKGAWDDAVKDLLEAARLRPGQYQAFASLSEAYRHKEQLAEAQKYLDYAITVAGRQRADKEIPAATLALLYTTRAGLHLDRKDRAAAINDLKKAARLAGKGPLTARAHADRGRVYHLQKDWPAALDAYDAALRQDANLVDIYHRRGEVLLALERYADAIEAFDGYLARKGPPSVAVYQGRGNACFRLGRYVEAITDFGLALAAGPADKDKATLHLSRGRLYVGLNAAAPALRDFEAVLKLTPTSAHAWMGSAQAQMLLRKPQEAVAAAERAVQGKSTEPRLWLDASRVFAQSGVLVAAEPLPEDLQRRLRAEYLERSVVLLNQAMRRVKDGQQRSYWRDNVEKDRALDPIRGLPEFIDLQARFGNPQPKKSVAQPPFTGAPTIPGFTTAATLEDFARAAFSGVVEPRLPDLEPLPGLFGPTALELPTERELVRGMEIIRSQFTGSQPQANLVPQPQNALAPVATLNALAPVATFVPGAPDGGVDWRGNLLVAGREIDTRPFLISPLENALLGPRLK
jgi:tetratricopeptide (TPR) repeat protein